MKGYLWTTLQREPVHTAPMASLAPWESMAIDAVGNAIEFWGFKRNQGRVWALLYLRGESMTASTIEHELSLSKGAVSMLIRDLERWGVILRVRAPGNSAWQYQAETDLIKMVTRVIEEREADFVDRIREDIAQARRLAEADPSIPPDRLARLARMATLADHTERAIRLFVKTAKLDVGSMFGVFREHLAARRSH